MTTGAYFVVAITTAGVWLAFVAHAHNRRLRLARERLEGSGRRHQERAAQAATRPHTGNVAAFPVDPPTNGTP